MTNNKHTFTPDSYDDTGCAECGEDWRDPAHGSRSPDGPLYKMPDGETLTDDPAEAIRAWRGLAEARA